ncbi:Prevent host death protein, Phd antitoxin |nr:Prevent host death protein, Phd antitoxin \
MQASIVDLRYKTSSILDAIDNNEQVDILYHGKKKATIVPVLKKQVNKVHNHAFFNMSKNDKTVLQELSELRSHRYDI